MVGEQKQQSSTLFHHKTQTVRTNRCDQGRCIHLNDKRENGCRRFVHFIFLHFLNTFCNDELFLLVRLRFIFKEIIEKSPFFHFPTFVPSEYNNVTKTQLCNFYHNNWKQASTKSWRDCKHSRSWKERPAGGAMCCLCRSLPAVYLASITMSSHNPPCVVLTLLWNTLWNTKG